MKTSQNGLKLIKDFEGLRLQPYVDAVGIPTIGYGNTYYENGAKVKLTDEPITEQRATELLQYVLTRYEDAVNRYVQVPMTQNQFDALVSFAYNVGNENLRKSTLLKLLNRGQPALAAQQFTRWNRAGGKVLKGLVRRRAAEMALFMAVA